MKKLIMSLLCFSFIFSLTSQAYAKEKENKSKIQLVYILQGTLPSDSDQELISVLQDSGWKITGNQMEKRILGRQQEITMEDGKKIKTDKEGILDLPIVGEEQEIEFKDKEGKAILKAKLKKDKVTTVETKVDFHQLLKGMGNTEHQENVGEPSWHDGNTSWGQVNGVRPSAGHETHCNRFNGYQGNGKYYSNETSSGAIANFAKSDCDWALALWTVGCLADYQPIDSLRYCSGSSTAKRAKCSDWADINPLAEHSRKFHMHTSPNGPTGK